MLKKKLVLLVLMFAFALGLCATAESEQAFAATKKKGMDTSVLVKLKEGKEYSAKASIPETKKKLSMKYGVSNIEVKDSAQKGYKELTFTYTYKAKNVVLSNKSIHAKVNGYGENINFFYTLVDTKTGKCLECANEFDVTCESDGWDKVPYNAQYDDDDCSYYFYKSATSNVTVTYPASYKNLAIIAGIYSGDPLGNDGFWYGYDSFEETTMYASAEQFNILYKKIK